MNFSCLDNVDFQNYQADELSQLTHACKVIQNPTFNSFAIRNPESKHWSNPESFNPQGPIFWNPESTTDLESGIQVVESRIQGAESGTKERNPESKECIDCMGVPGEGGGSPPVCWTNKASRAIFASQSGNIRFTVGQYWFIIKINGTNSVNFVGSSVNIVGNMLSNRNFS